FLFKYSARPDTRSYRMPETVSEEDKGRRLTFLIDLQQEISRERNEAWIGREVEVLVEGPARRDPDQLFGRTPQFKAVAFPHDGSAPGTLSRVRVAGASASTLVGTARGSRAAPRELIEIR